MKQMLKGLYVITDKKLVPWDKFVANVEKAVKGGANVVQLREKDTPRGDIVSLGKDLLNMTKKYGVPLIVNDSMELASEIGADGVHLGEDDPPVAYARDVLGNDKIIGVSCYGKIDRGLNAEREGADYVAFGTPYFTPTKPERMPTSFDILREAISRIKRIPIFAIGGITPENADSVLETGVDGIAVITAVFGSDDPERAAKKLAEIAQKHLNARN
ncbi:MAG: thiamine phosphate synthase [Thermodesulfobacteriota bacterium]